jgi:hypothetical protein
LKQALSFGGPEIFNTDHGSQFASDDWTKVLLKDESTLNTPVFCLDIKLSSDINIYWQTLTNVLYFCLLLDFCKIENTGSKWAF